MSGPDVTPAEPAVAWQVDTCDVSQTTGGLVLTGTNHYTGEKFSWNVSHYGLVWSYRARYGRFRGARFGPGARARLAVLLRMARRDARS